MIKCNYLVTLGQTKKEPLVVKNGLLKSVFHTVGDCMQAFVTYIVKSLFVEVQSPLVECMQSCALDKKQMVTCFLTVKTLYRYSFLLASYRGRCMQQSLILVFIDFDSDYSQSKVIMSYRSNDNLPILI